MDICEFLRKPSSYILVLELKKDFIGRIRSLGIIKLGKGRYLYIGSAKRGAITRLKRYCYKQISKPYWHIDYLVLNAEVIGAYVITYIDEEALAQHIAKFLRPSIRRFGATDTRDITHLFEYDEKRLLEALRCLNYIYVDCDEISKCLGSH